MKVFVVQNIDGEVCKTFLNKEAAVAWCTDQCRNWAKNMGETSDVFVDDGSDTHVIADKNGYEKRVRLPATAINCMSGSEYTITETVAELA